MGKGSTVKIDYFDSHGDGSQYIGICSSDKKRMTQSTLGDLLSGFYDFDAILEDFEKGKALKQKTVTTGSEYNTQAQEILNQFFEKRCVVTSQLVTALVHLTDADNIMEEAQEKRLGIEEKYKGLKPEGFEHSLYTAKRRRETLRDNNDVDQMEYLQSSLAYNKDKTVKLKKIDEIFNPDLTGYNQSCGRGSAKELCNQKDYHLLSDYQPPRRFTDIHYCNNQSHKVEEDTDWYRLKNTFGNYVGSLADMVGMINSTIPYWTGSESYDSTREEPRAIVRYRDLGRGTRIQRWFNTSEDCYVCGFKNK